jgi:putative membrane protein
MTKSLLALVAVVLTLAWFIPVSRAANEAGEKKKMSAKDTKFIENAAAGGQMEVDLGKNAVEKGSSDDVKKFGQTMVDDHSKANDELKQLASQKGVDLTKSMDKAMKKSEKQIEKLNKDTGEAFDKAYMDGMVKDHEKDVKEFEEASKDADDADLKAWAGKTLPTLQSHLQTAKDIQGKMKK